MAADERRVDPETGRPRSDEEIGGARSPKEEEASRHAGTISPGARSHAEQRTGKKLSQWGPGTERISWYRERYLKRPGRE